MESRYREREGGKERGGRSERRKKYSFVRRVDTEPHNVCQLDTMVRNKLQKAVACFRLKKPNGRPKMVQNFWGIRFEPKLVGATHPIPHLFPKLVSFDSSEKQQKRPFRVDCVRSKILFRFRKNEHALCRWRAGSSVTSWGDFSWLWRNRFLCFLLLQHSPSNS